MFFRFFAKRWTYGWRGRQNYDSQGHASIAASWSKNKAGTQFHQNIKLLTWRLNTLWRFSKPKITDSVLLFNRGSVFLTTMYIGEWVSYSYAAESFHTRKFLADFLTEIQFNHKNSNSRLSHPLEDVTWVMYRFHLELIGKQMVNFLVEIFLPSLIAEALQVEICRCQHYWRGGSF